MKSDDIKITHANYDIVFKSLTGLFKDQTLEFYGLKCSYRKGRTGRTASDTDRRKTYGFCFLSVR